MGTTLRFIKGQLQHTHTAQGMAAVSPLGGNSVQPDPRVLAQYKCSGGCAQRYIFLKNVKYK